TGVGASNLPYTNGQLGAQSTRAMHPTALALIQDVVNRVSARSFALELQNLYTTKGELCRTLAHSEFEDLATVTVSCDSTLRVPGPKQCGVCTSCLLRRQALRVAGIYDNRDDTYGYQNDVFEHSRDISAENRYAFDAM